MPTKKTPHDVLAYGCLVNFADKDSFIQYCEELEQSIQELSCAIENRRAKKEERKLIVKRD